MKNITEYGLDEMEEWNTAKNKFRDSGCGTDTASSSSSLITASETKSVSTAEVAIAL